MAGQKRDCKYWLTTYWAFTSESGVQHHLYLKPRYRDSGREVAPGDGVAFFEMKGPAPKGLFESRPPGKGAITIIARVAGPWRTKMPRSAADEWTLEAVCDHHTSGGSVKATQICRVMKWKPGYRFRGLGGGSGLRELSAEQFKELSDLFFASRK